MLIQTQISFLLVVFYSTLEVIKYKKDSTELRKVKHQFPNINYLITKAERRYNNDKRFWRSQDPILTLLWRWLAK